MLEFKVSSEALQNTKTRLGCPGLKEGAPFVDVWRALRPTDESYTYWSYRFNGKAKNRGWRLDYFVVAPSLMPHIQTVFRRPHLHGASDHVPLGIVTDFPKLKAALPLKKQRSINSFFSSPTASKK